MSDTPRTDAIVLAANQKFGMTEDGAYSAEQWAANNEYALELALELCMEMERELANCEMRAGKR